jgi:hypothetical protein
LGAASSLCVPETLKFLFPFRHHKVLVPDNGRLKVIWMGLSVYASNIRAHIPDPSVAGDPSLGAVLKVL